MGLLTCHADPAVITTDKKTSLMLATLEGKVEVVKELMRLKSCRGQITEKDDGGSTALHHSCKHHDVEIVKLLIDNNARVGARDALGRQPLMVACEHGKLECAKLLSKKSAV